MYSNRVVQHYTSNPIKAYAGVVDQPIVAVTYMLRGDQHISECINTLGLFALHDDVRIGFAVLYCSLNRLKHNITSLSSVYY